MRFPRMSNTAFYAVVAALLFGVFLTFWNIYQLSVLQNDHMKSYHGRSQSSVGAQKGSLKQSLDQQIVWVHGKYIERGYLNHVIEVFERIGYTRGGAESDWDVLWAHDYPFTQLQEVIKNLKPHQKVNHFPGTGFITNKVYLATSDIKYIPKAFSLPDQKHQFLAEAKEHPDKLWVQKSSSHRGIIVKPIKELDLTIKKTFIQEFVSNPYLIDGKKFDIGIYTVLTSVDPLRVYMLDRETLVRFCPQEYNPIDFKNVDKYVIGDDYTPVWEMPSLKKYYNEMKYNFKETLNAYIRTQDQDPTFIYSQVYESIRSLFLNKHSNLVKALEKYKYKRTFFELMRCDFVLDEDLNLYLMEVNMSPNLSSAHFEGNVLLYDQVVYNVLSVSGIARNTPFPQNSRSKKSKDMEASERDIQVKSDVCSSPTCDTCTSQECHLCYKCLSEERVEMLKEAFIEHNNRQGMRRVYPEAMTQDEAMTYDPTMDDELLQNDQLMRAWFRSKCVEDPSWCQ